MNPELHVEEVSLWVGKGSQAVLEGYDQLDYTKTLMSIRRLI